MVESDPSGDGSGFGWSAASKFAIMLSNDVSTGFIDSMLRFSDGFDARSAEGNVLLICSVAHEGLASFQCRYLTVDGVTGR